MLTQAAQLDHLKAIPLFSYCSRKELRSLGLHSITVRVPAGQLLLRQGDRGGEFFVVVAGTAEVTRDGAVVDVVGPGDFFGELAMLDRAPRNATVTATEAMELLVFSRSDFEAVLFDAPLMTRRLLTAMARRLRGLDRRNRGDGALA
ncbi:MAG TPA: cyclic nucleotide-binding domain-containing protein [Sporichthya sp.]|nr:cyclic nucleotide-binding domain-containing protein [Sporichthya sp.]